MPEPTTTKSNSKVPPLAVGQVLRRRLVLAYVFLIVVIIGIGIGSTYSGTGFAVSLSIVEIVVLLFTLLILVLLSVFTTESFSNEVTKITTTFERESSAMLERSQHHWAEQTESLTRATAALNAVVELETEALKATQESLRSSTALLELERQRESLRAEEARLRLQRIRPSMAFRGVITHPGPIAKRIGVRLFNQGEDGRRITIDLRYGSGRDEVASRTIPAIAAFSNSQVDCGDIDEWSDAVSFLVEVGADDVDGNRYRCTGTLEYSRNRGLVLSDPSFSPDDWQYPEMTRV